MSPRTAPRSVSRPSRVEPSRVEAAVHRFVDRLFGFSRPASRRELYLLRAFELFAVICTVKYAWGWALYVQNVSDVVLPLGLANYLDVSVLFGSWLAFGVAALVTLFAGLGLARQWSFGYLAALLCLHLLFAARYSQGEIPHSSNVLGMTLLGLGLGFAAFDAERLRQRFALGFTFFSIGLGYTSAAVCKLVGTGPLWVDGRHLQLWVYEKSIDIFAATGSLDFTAAQSLVLDHYWIATLFLVIGFVTETFAFLMWWPRFRLVGVLAVLGLHAGIYATMQIVFAVTTVELVLLALLWALLVERLLATSHSDEEALLPAAVGALLPSLNGRAPAAPGGEVVDASDRDTIPSNARPDSDRSRRDRTGTSRQGSAGRPPSSSP